MKFLGLGIAGATLIGAMMLSSAASAAPLMVTGANSGQITSDNQIIQVQAGRRGGARAFGGGGGGRVAGGRSIARGGIVRGGGRGFARGGGGRGFGAAAVGLGVLGAAVAIGAAASQPSYRECWVERQPAHDGWGNFIGYRNVRVCN